MTSETERTPDVNNACGSVADRANRTEPGELMRLAADGLTACGDVEWECAPQAGGEMDPKQIADIAATLLTGQAQAYPRLGTGYGHGSVTFKGIVGLELKARGFHVDLEVYQDEDYFDARAEIVVTSTGSGDGATVYV